MYLKFIVVVMGGFILSTNLWAAELTNKSAPKAVDKNTQDNLTKEHLKKMEHIHYFNSIFDDYHTGGTPYTPYEKIPHETIKGK